MGLGSVCAHAEADSQRPTVSSSPHAEPGASPAPASALPTSAPSDSAPEQATGAIHAPRPLQSLSVDYPEQARGEHTVILELLVGVAGTVEHIVVRDGAEPFASAAVRAAAGWNFTPAVRGGQRLAARIRVQVRFAPPPPTTVDVASPIARSPAGDTPAPTIEVIVVGDQPRADKTLGRADVRQLPGAFGDPFRAVEALPGVTPIASGLPYFFVRGAPPGNVGYFFDELSVPLLYHGAAGPGVIHPAFVEEVNLYPAAYPAKYGRYAGGIVEGELARPEQRWRGHASVRLLDAGGFVEAPLADGRANLMLGGRYSYTGLLLSAFSSDVNVGYWDYQALGTYAFGPSDELSLLAFGSHDYVAGVDGKGNDVELLNLTFHRARAKYTKLVSPRTRLSASLVGGTNRTGLNDDVYSQPWHIVGHTLGGRITADHQLAPSVAVQVGADVYWSGAEVDGKPEPKPVALPVWPRDPKWRTLHSGLTTDWRAPSEFSGTKPLDDPASRLPQTAFPPGVGSNIPDVLRETESFVRDQFTAREDLLGGAWLELAWQPTRRVQLRPALRLDAFRIGRRWMHAFDPRLTARYRISDTLTLVQTLGVAHQPPSFTIPLPGVGPRSTGDLQTAIQSSAGAQLTLPSSVFASATAYQNVTLNSSDALSISRFGVASESTDPFSNRTTAHSYGVEFLVQRSFSKSFGGLFAYTLSRSTRSAANASGVSSFDRTHVLNLAAAYELGRNWRFGARLVTYSGIPATVGNARALVSPPRTSWFYRVDWRLEKRWALSAAGGWIALVAEVVNTTLNQETLSASCYAYGCTEQTFGPVTLPSLGVEASL